MMNIQGKKLENNLGGGQFCFELPIIILQQNKSMVHKNTLIHKKIQKIIKPHQTLLFRFKIISAYHH